LSRRGRYLLQNKIHFLAFREVIEAVLPLLVYFKFDDEIWVLKAQHFYLDPSALTTKPYTDLHVVIPIEKYRLKLYCALAKSRFSELILSLLAYECYLIIISIVYCDQEISEDTYRSF
jgi:hypothetical protein